MPQHQVNEPLSLQGRRNNTQVYEQEYPLNGKGQLCSARVYQTTFCFHQAYIQQSFPAFQTGGFCKHHAPQYRERPFPYGNMANNL